MAGYRLVRYETVAYKATQTDGEHRRGTIVAVWVLWIVLFGDSRDHLADGEA